MSASIPLTARGMRECPICHAEHCPEERPDCRERGDARGATYDGAEVCIWPDPPPPPLPRKRKRRPQRAKVMP